jgi:hypothetical protein
LRLRRLLVRFRARRLNGGTHHRLWPIGGPARGGQRYRKVRFPPVRPRGQHAALRNVPDIPVNGSSTMRAHVSTAEMGHPPQITAPRLTDAQTTTRGGELRLASFFRRARAGSAGRARRLRVTKCTPVEEDRDRRRETVENFVCACARVPCGGSHAHAHPNRLSALRAYRCR